jgi:hypothetical protein
MEENKMNYDIKLDSEKIHEALHIRSKVISLLFDYFEKYDNENYQNVNGLMEIDIGTDTYDNSIEVYIKYALEYPWEPCKEMRDLLYDYGFSIVFWNFSNDGNDSNEEIRGWEPRHYNDSKEWTSDGSHFIQSKHGYVDNRYNEKEWENKYWFHKK